MKNNAIKMLGIGLVSSLAFTACSDQFLEDKKNYDNVNPGIYDYYEGAYGRVSDAYGWTLPNCNTNANWKFNSTGLADDQAIGTEEYTGFGPFVNPLKELKSVDSPTVPDYYMGDASNIQASVYGRIRNINEIIDGISNSKLDEASKNEFLGQVYFLRAWCYYQLVKWYGGVPLVKTMVDPTEDAHTPRSSAKECITFILDDLQKSADLLREATGNGGWKSSNDWGRVTTGTALALKGRVLLLWASPLFNRANDQSRWDNAYTEMEKDLPIIRACGYGLYEDGNPTNGATFAKIFTQVKSPENVFVTIRSSKDPDENGYSNFWEEYIRPKNSGGKGNLTPSQTMIDLFPMKDGKRPATYNAYNNLPTSTHPYVNAYPFMDRDPRFYRTFAFPGFRWSYSGDATVNDGNNPSYNTGKDYELWSYVWYVEENSAGNPESGDAYAADNLLKNNKSVYLRKRSDDADLNSPLYVYEPSYNTSASAFRFSGAPYIELRFAEVLLNYAEAACMAGHTDIAMNQIKAIRQRAGYTGDCGLSGIGSDKPSCMSAILYERQIEFAYEGKRFDDLRRWMLFDGGAELAEGAPASWVPTGWGGNTCTWLGFKPLNGQRREGLEYRTADIYGIGGTTKDSDPLVVANVERCAAVDLRKADLDTQLQNLHDWYETHLVYKMKKGDEREESGSGNTDLYMKFFPKYYFLGLTKGALEKDVKIQQTIGWDDTVKANGTFDPLAE